MGHSAWQREASGREGAQPTTTARPLARAAGAAGHHPTLPRCTGILITPSLMVRWACCIAYCGWGRRLARDRPATPAAWAHAAGACYQGSAMAGVRSTTGAIICHGHGRLTCSPDDACAVHVNQPHVTHAAAAPGTVMACPIPGTHHVCMHARTYCSSACLCAQPALTKRAPLSPTLAASSPRLAVATLDRNAKGLTGGRHGLGVSCGGRPLFYSGAGLRRCLHSSPRQEARCNTCLCAPHWLMVPGRGRSRNTPATNAGPAQKCVLWVSKATAGVARAPLSCRACTGCGQRL